MTAAGQFAEADVSEELMVTLMRRGRIDADSIGVDDSDVEGAKKSQGRVGGIIEGDVRKFGMRHADHHQAQGSAGAEAFYEGAHVASVTKCDMNHSMT